MKRIIALVLLVALSLTLFSACGKTASEKLLDKYSEIANFYSSLSSSVSFEQNSTDMSNFVSMGIELTEIASRVSRDRDSLSEEELQKFSSALDKIDEKLKEIEKTFIKK
ncbi:MAG: hypothetical protein IKU65_03530 [Oscillospiraceae bacterium]|nr:hypothetical protein [Oscillospiraceae bacterium]